MARNEPAAHPLLPSSHLWLEMSPPPTLFPSPYTFPTLTLSLAEARETQEALLARAASIAQGRRRVQPREDMEEELTSDEEDVEDSPMDLLNNGVVFRGPEDITSKDFTSHLAKWDKQDDGLISKMLCCAFCGQCELGGRWSLRPTALLQSLHHLGPTEQHSRCPPTVSPIPISRTTCKRLTGRCGIGAAGARRRGKGRSG